MKTTFLLLLFSLKTMTLCGTGCICCLADEGEVKEDNEPMFRLPVVPDTLRTVEKRLNYVVANYWNHFDFKDTIYDFSSNAIEQVVVDYIDLLERTSSDVASASLEVMLSRASESHEMLKYINKIMRRYLIEPDSPLRSDDLYEYVARFLSLVPSLDEATKARVQYDLDLILKNKKGSVANDFRLVLSDGDEKRIHEFESEYLLLLFFNPDCPSCMKVIDELKNSPEIVKSIDRKELLLLTVYPENEIDLWCSFVKGLPDAWLNGWDESQVILEKHLYDLRNMPVIYLLDADKRVLLKDVSVRQVEQYFESSLR